ncbi:hypothetical protein IFM46972_07970 [Aspergillus udagawae]|uniref:Uncharacterized protein n=1 Tax=Aspergillus udagawae TaxID=91492 RepID=A0A8H3P5H5_9EURO|nr:hypothetical protein IFM46972_07970 [Aspergillus udagawae]
MPFACIYEAILSLDAIYHKNNICLLAICASNICVAVYAVLQYTKIEGAIDSVRASTDGMGDHLVDISRDIWIYIRPAELAVPVMLGIGTLVLVPASCRLHKDYAWAIYKCIQGNTELRLRYIAYKVYLVLIKFDFFFLVAFIVQYDLIDVHFKEPEYSLTMAFIPASLLVMVFGIYCVKAELKIAMGFIISFHVTESCCRHSV